MTYSPRPLHPLSEPLFDDARWYQETLTLLNGTRGERTIADKEVYSPLTIARRKQLTRRFLELRCYEANLEQRAEEILGELQTLGGPTSDYSNYLYNPPTFNPRDMQRWLKKSQRDTASVWKAIGLSVSVIIFLAVIVLGLFILIEVLS